VGSFLAELRTHLQKLLKTDVTVHIFTQLADEKGMEFN
jgi:hypothetical protein